jgi:site-specific recombinase XerD
MGTVFRRMRKDSGKSKWYVLYFYGGKRIKRLAHGAETKTEAKAFLRNIERKIELDEYMPKKKQDVLFEDWLEKYYNWSRLNKQSWQRDRTSKSHLKPFFKGKLLREITPFFVENYKEKRKSQNFTSNASINRELSLLKHLFNMAIKEGLIHQNPVKGVRFFQERTLEFKVLSDEEKELLINCCNGITKIAVVIALNTGMRRTEILSLKWTEIDFNQSVICVLRSKSGKPRTIPMNSFVFDTLMEYYNHRAHDEYVFWNAKKKKPIQDLKKSFKTACADAGIKKMRFHDLRHNFATTLVMNKVDIATIAELMGHSDINLTAQRYIHISSVHKKLAVESIIIKKEDLDEVLPKVLPKEISKTSN